MKIALVQINPMIGDFAGNIEKICEMAADAARRGCALAVFPELAVCGYPPQDLLDRPAFVDAQLAALDALGRRVKELGIDLVCGVVTRHTHGSGKPLHNSAALITAHGRALAHKQLLPTYDVFDERRYFEPAAPGPPLDWRGLRLGVTICEDVFFDESAPAAAPGPERLYAADPVAALMDHQPRPDLLINIAASPFQVGKPGRRREFLRALARRHRIPLLYANQVGGQDSLVFDGHSLAIDADGRITAQAPGFEEHLLVVEITAPPPAAVASGGGNDEEEVLAALVTGTRDYVRKCGFTRVVLGLSGGIDSALTAAIAARALGPRNVLGVALPSPYTSQASIDDARALAANLGIDFTTIPISGIFEQYLATLAPHFDNAAPDVTEQNIQARIRGNLLMALANKSGRLLLSTGNKSELAVGYCTLYGDMSGGLAVISDVPKTMVYTLCRFLNREEEIIPAAVMEKPPSAELAPDQKDEDDLPPYAVLDPILAGYLEENLDAAGIAARGFDPRVVRDVIGRVNRNEHKRKQAPIGIKVTSKAFGYGRRYPICQRFTDPGGEDS